MLFLSLRHLLSRKRQTFLILFGISLGTTIYVVISGMQLGFREYMIDQLINNDAHVKVSAREETITKEGMTKVFYGESEDRPYVFWEVPPSGKRDEAHILYPQGWFDRLLADHRVVAYSPQLRVQAILTRGGVREAAQIVGVDPTLQMKVTNIENYMVEGKFHSIGFSGNRLVMGDGLLKALGARVSETVLVTVGSGSPRPFKIVGSFHIGMQPVDDATAYGALRDIQQLNQTPAEISDIAISLVDVDRAHEVAELWSYYSRDKVQSWDEANANFLQIFRIQDIVRNSITVAILIVAGFGIYNVLSIQISQKKREIAILRSLGYSTREVLLLFLNQGVILGISGAFLGLGLGYLICKYISTIDLELMGQRGFLVSYNPSIYVVGTLLAIVSSLLASVLPARAASRLTPIEIIRSEV